MFGLDWMIGAPFEDTYAALHLILSGLTTRYPHIKIISCHLGGTLPFLMQRIDHQYAPGAAPIQEKPGTLARRFWFDTVAHGSIPALRCACETFGSSRLVLGTDYPYQLWERYKEAITYVQDAGLPAGDVDAILDQTAVQLLDLK